MASHGGGFQEDSTVSGKTPLYLLSKGLTEHGIAISPSSLSCRWCTQLASAMVHLHGRPDPILHRDLHPDNIMLTNDKPQSADIRLVDFGLHRILTKAAQGGWADASNCFSSDHPMAELTCLPTYMFTQNRKCCHKLADFSPLRHYCEVAQPVL
jgi:serine/threonine protein kinase